MMRHAFAILIVLLAVAGCSKKEPVATRDDHVCEPVRIAEAYLAMMEKPDAARTLLIGADAKALEAYFKHGGMSCATTLDGTFDLIVADCRRMSKSSFAALRGVLKPDGVIAWMMDVRGVSMKELHSRMSDFELYDVHLWMPGRDRWLLVGSAAPRKIRLEAILNLFARERTFKDLAKAKCGTVPEMFANYAGAARDFAPAFAQQAGSDVEVRPEFFLTKDIPAVDWLLTDGVDADIAGGILADMRSMQVVRRLAVQGAMLSQEGAGATASTNAIEFLSRAAKRNPNDLFIVERLERLDRNARGFLEMGQLLMAMKCFETMVLIQPNDAAAVHNFGMCLKKIGKTKLAEEVLKRAEMLAQYSSVTAQPARSRPSEPRKVINIINFVRAIDPRTPRAVKLEALRNEVALNRKHDLPNTILLQYDAMVDAEMLAAARASDAAKTEFGVWIELCREVVEKAGAKWCNKRGWDWDWHINPGFLMAYETREREAIVDRIFAKFKELFGAYPKSVGSWLLDAHSIDYMTRKYGVDGFIICREQDSTDAYGLRGGYSNGLYYPSRRNMLSAAADMKNAIPAPIFKMLTPDPIYNYARPERFYADYPPRHGCPTMEPWWKPGKTPRVVDWYFGCYLDAPGLINLSYMQTGQENSVGWKSFGDGLVMQLDKLDRLLSEKRITVETMGETARRFKRDHRRNCPQTQVALTDWTGNGRQSVWYNCANYRANLMTKDGRAYFRDIHVMRDDFDEPYLNTACKRWQANYFTPPVVDEYLFRTNGISGVMSLSGKFTALEVRRGANDSLIADLKRETGDIVRVTFDETAITVRGAHLDFECPASFRKHLTFEKNRVGMAFQGYRYAIATDARVRQTEKGYALEGETLRLVLGMP